MTVSIGTARRAIPPTRELRGKRLFDVAVSAAGIVALSPAIGVIAIAVRFSGPGPVLYRGIRVGLGGEPFVILKFRTMSHRPSDPGAYTTAAGDPRVTPLGSILRRRKLDELPQLFNVLRGDMSIVGPRPEFAYWLERYTCDDLAILSVRPGITDYSSLEFIHLADVVGNADPDQRYLRDVFKRKNQLRLQYVNHLSWRTDLGIIWATLRRVVLSR